MKLKSSSKTVKDIYKEYSKQLLKDNPEYWGKYQNKTKNYKIYTRVNGKPTEVTSYPRFRNVVEVYFKTSNQCIIDGKSLSLGKSLGRIQGNRVERNFSNKVPNWKATKEMWEKKGERKGLVYHVDEDWVRIGWAKGRRVKNERFYEFSPAEGNKNGTGFKKEFSDANLKNPFLKLKYVFHPFIRRDD